MDLNALGRHVAAQEDGWLGATRREEREQQRQRIAEAAVRDLTARHPWARLAMAVCAAGVLGAAIAVFALRGRALSFAAGEPSRESAVGDWLSAPPGGSLPITFSDGSRITLQSGARGRVANVRPSGADWVLESGKARFDVVPRPGNEWRVLMGPFKVEVVGTRFDVAWTPDREELALDLEHGSVIVNGCGLGAGQHVEAGQRLRVSCPTRTFSVAPLAAEMAPHGAGTAAASSDARNPYTALESLPPASAEPARIADSPPPATAQPPIAPAASWQDLARRGHFERAFAIAGDGFERECADGSAEDVLLLADAARLSGHAALARTAYRTARRRFPGSADAARAAFHLGQLDAQGGAAEAAARWFETYLEEQPSSSLAEAALGRLVELRAQQGNRRLSERAAALYLERFPQGPHADKAKSIVGLPRPAP